MCFSHRPLAHLLSPCQKAFEFVEEDDRDLFICPICLDALPECTVTTGCHHFCALCLSVYYNTNKKNVLPCPVCYKPIHVHDVKPISDHFLMIINKVRMNCKTCGMSGRLHGMRRHYCTSTPTKCHFQSAIGTTSDEPRRGPTLETAIQTISKSYHTQHGSSPQRPVSPAVEKKEEKLYFAPHLPICEQDNIKRYK